MFEYLGTILTDIDPGFDVLRYLTVRTLGGTVTALLITILLGPMFINKLKQIQFEQFVRKEGPKSHYKKTGTPTMGGILIISSLLISTLLWADLSNRYIWVVIITTLLFAGNLEVEGGINATGNVQSPNIQALIDQITQLQNQILVNTSNSTGIAVRSCVHTYWNPAHIHQNQGLVWKRDELHY